MKKILLTLCLLIGYATLHAATETVDGITWTYQVSNGEARIYNNYSSVIPSSTSGAITIPTTLGGYPVTSIGNYAFYECSSLTSVTIPEGVTSIGYYAFAYCSGLISLDFKGKPPYVGSYAFYDIPSSAKGYYLPQYASEWKSVIDGNGKWNRLTMVCLEENPDEPSNPSIIDPKFFTYEIKDDVVTITGVQGNYPSVITIPTTLGGYPVTSIGPSAFGDCKSLTSVTIPSSVTSIGDSAFYGCSGLTSVTIPSSVTSIGEGVFSGCSSLTSVTIPEGVTIATSSGVEISNGTWSAIDVSDIGYSHGYRSPTIGHSSSTSMSVKVVGPMDFSFKWKVSSESGYDYLRWYLDGTQKDSISGTGGGWKTVSCSIPEGEHTIRWTYSKDGSATSGSDCGWVAFNSASVITTFAGCSNLKEVTLPCNTTTPLSKFFPNAYTTLERVTLTGESETIADNLFVGCASLQAIEIPSNVTSIGNSAFSDCWRLTSVTIPSSVTTIGEKAFRYCYDLTSVTIPEGVASIGAYTFEVCSSLTSVTIPSSVTSIGNYAFAYCSRLTSVDFKGKPPRVGSYAFYDIPSSATGTYLPQYASEWEAVIVDGTWKGLTMVQKEMATLPEGLPEATGEWLTDVLEASGITSGSAVLAEGTTVEALEAARLLGITPSISVSGSIASVAAESTFDVSEVVVAENAVSLAVTITVEAGRFPTEVSLGGAVKLMVCDTLNGEWTEITPAPSQIKLTRMSDTEATLAVTQALDTYKFFKVLVK